METSVCLNNDNLCHFVWLKHNLLRSCVENAVKTQHFVARRNNLYQKHANSNNPQCKVFVQQATEGVKHQLNGYVKLYAIGPYSPLSICRWNLKQCLWFVSSYLCTKNGLCSTLRISVRDRRFRQTMNDVNRRLTTRKFWIPFLLNFHTKKVQL